MTSLGTGYQHHHDADQGPRPYQADAAGHHDNNGRTAWAVAGGVVAHPDAPAAARRAVVTSTCAAAATGDAVLGIQSARGSLVARRESGFGGDATLVLAVTTPDGIDIAWVGDSRAYDLSGDTAVQLTVDHNLGTRLRLEGHNVPDSSYLYNRLTSHLCAGEIGHVRIPAPVQRLLLATDGLYRVLEPGDLLTDAARRFRSRPDALTHRLMIAVRNRGAVDNATALVIQST